MGVGPLSVGLSTGINYGEIIDGLINVEKQPVSKLEQKIEINNLKQRAYDELNGLALTAKLSMFDLASSSTFDSKLATSSDETVFTASASTSAETGTHSIQVVNLATNSVSLSTGIADTDSTAIGSGTLTFELGGRKLNEGTPLDDLNGGAGVSRGKVLITDSTGKSFDVDLSDAITVDDVLDKFNANTLGFSMSVARTYNASTDTFTGDGSYLTITNNSTNSITLSDVSNGTTLTDLGLKAETIATTASSTNTTPLYYVTKDTKLNKINDYMGVRTTASGTKDLRFYVLNTATNLYNSVEVDLNGSTDVGDVINKINTAIFEEQLNAYADIKLSADGIHLEFTGTVTNAENINGSMAATDLGLDDLTSGKSANLIADLNSTLIRNINGGHGIKDMESGVFKIVSRAGIESHVNLHGSISTEDINRVISAALKTEAGGSNGFTSKINDTGDGFKLTDSTSTTSVTSAFIVEDITGNVAEQLGISTDFKVRPVIFNAYDYVNDSSATNRKSTVWLDVNSLPEGISENDMVGKQVKHVYTSAITYAGNTYPRDGVETAKISAFEAAADAFSVDITNASLGSATLKTSGSDLNTDGTNEDQLYDTRGLSTTLNSSLDSTQIVGATLTVNLSNGTSASSSIVNYDSENTKVILADNAITTAMATAGLSGDTDIQKVGYTISYNHKVILDYPDPTTFTDTSNVTFPGGNVFQDTTNLPTTIDQSRAIGAQLVVTDSAGTTYTGIVESISASNQLKLVAASDGITGTIPLATMQNASTSYKLLYNPIHNGNGGSNTYLSNNSGNPDMITIQGINDGSIVGKNVEKRMISGETRLDALNGGEGIDRDRFYITVGSAVVEIDLKTKTSIQTVQNLIDEINSQTSSVKVEVNDRGDGLRIYDITSDQTSSTGISVTEVDKGSSAADLNLLKETLGRKQIAITNNTDFETLSATAPAGATTTSLTVTGWTGLDRKDVIGSTISFTSSADSLQHHALVTNYTTTSTQSTLTLAGMVSENGDAGANADIANATVNLHLKKHYDDFVRLGTTQLPGATSDTARTFTMTLTDTYSLFSTMTKEEAIGSLVNIRGGDNNENEGGTGMVTNFDPSTGSITVQAHYLKPTTIDTNMTISMARDSGFRHQINNGPISTSLGWLSKISTSGFVSDTATIKSGTTSTTLFSDQFSNLDREEIIGALITVKDSTSSSLEGNVGIVTDYDAAAKSITVGGGFYSSTGTATTTTLSANDEVNITYRSEMVGAVVRSAAQSDIFVGDKDITVSDANGAGEPKIVTTNSVNSTTLIEVGDLLSTTNTLGAYGDFAKLAGATITFGAGTGTAALANDTATITKVHENYNGVTGSNVIELSTALDATPATTDDFTIAVKSEPISAQLANKRLIQVDAMLTSANLANGSVDKLIGATVSFHGNNPTAALNNESRTIVDVIKNYNNVSTQVALVLDKELPANPGTTDGFKISFPEIVATIEEVDFDTGVITTREKMATGMGNRSFNIHPVIDGSYQKDVKITKTDTLLDAISKINNADVGVKATVINDGSLANPYRLSLTATNSGLAGGVVTSSNITGFEVIQTTSAQDAKVVLGDSTGNSSAVLSKSNVITDAINGVTLNLTNTSSETLTLTVKNDSTSITEKATAFADEINVLLASVNQLTALENEVEVPQEDGTTRVIKQKGIFFGDFTARSLVSSIKNLINLQVESANSGQFALLSDVGFSLNEDGTLFEFDADAFKLSLDSKFDQVKNLFNTIPNISDTVAFGASSNFIMSGYDLNDLRNGLTRSSGFLENGNGTNGVKIQAGDTSKYMSVFMGSTKKLNGIKLYHHVPTDLTAEYSKTNAEIAASGTTLTKFGGKDILTDTTYFGSGAQIRSTQIVGSTVTIGSKTSTVESYNADTGKITLADTTISTALGTGTLSGLTTGGFSFTTTSGNLSIKHNAELQYKDPDTGEYVTYQEFSNISDGLLSVFFPGGLETDELRLIYNKNTGDTEDFTENGSFVRLLEFEVNEGQGLGSQISSVLDGFTNASTGDIVRANQLINEINESYTTRISNLNEKIDNKQQQLIKQFQNLELIVSNLNSQSQFLLSQLGSLPKAFSHRGAN